MTPNEYMSAGQDRNGDWWVTKDGHYLARSDRPNRYVRKDDRIGDLIEKMRGDACKAVAVSIWPVCPPTLPFPVQRICAEVDDMWVAVFERGDGAFVAVDADYIDPVTAPAGPEAKDAALGLWAIDQLGGPLAPLRFTWNGTVTGYLQPIAGRDRS